MSCKLDIIFIKREHRYVIISFDLGIITSLLSGVPNKLKEHRTWNNSNAHSKSHEKKEADVMINRMATKQTHPLVSNFPSLTGQCQPTTTHLHHPLSTVYPLLCPYARDKTDQYPGIPTIRSKVSWIENNGWNISHRDNPEWEMFDFQHTRYLLRRDKLDWSFVQNRKFDHPICGSHSSVQCIAYSFHQDLKQMKKSKWRIFMIN